jgi:ATP synthase in type III secretion protein N
MNGLPALMPRRSGCIVATAGGVATVAGLNARVGDVCRFSSGDGSPRLGEVIALRNEHALVWLESGVHGLSAATPVAVVPRQDLFPVGPALLGRVLDAYGRALDGKPDPQVAERWPVHRPCPAPMSRKRIRTPFITRVRAIDGLCTLAIGQRMGIMAPAGVGKTTLLGMLARWCRSDVNVIGLVGERGREVREFVEESLGDQGLARSIVVCATSDRSPLERQRAAMAATTVAEYFRDRGANVLLMVDSLTRFARAYRELGLAQGEMPTRRGYPASLFACLPALLERSGPGPEGAGDITALYTVLMEDAETADPVAEEVKSLLDGHLLLSRSIAAGGQYPAVDVRHSISRLMSAVVSDADERAARDVRALLEKHAEIQPLAQMGEYKPGHDAQADRAMQKFEPLRQWLTQAVGEGSEFRATQRSLQQVLE